MTRRWLYAVLVVLAISLLVSSGSFSAVSADRGVTVAVTDDSSALLGYNATCEKNTFSVTITNRFETPLTDGSVTVGGTTTSLDDIAPGERTAVRFDRFEAGDPVTVTVDGPSNAVELDRSVPLDCQPPQEREVRFPGSSESVVVRVEDASGTYWTLDEQSSTFDLQSGNRLNSDSGRIAVVYIESTDTTYVHPGLAVSEDGSYDIEKRQESSGPCRFEGKVPLDEVDLTECG